MPIEKGEIEVIKQYIKDGDIVFDVGCNVGNWSKEVLKYKKDIMIHAFDPLPDFYYKNFYNSCYENNGFVMHNEIMLTKECDGIYDRFAFCYYKIYPPVSTFYRRSESVEKENIGCEPDLIEVNGTTLDKYCLLNRIKKINFLKIDVEGAELDVLQGSMDMLKNIDNIQFEYGGCNLDSHTTLKMLYDFLMEHGFNKIYKVLDNELKLINNYDVSLEDYQLVNYLAIR